ASLVLTGKFSTNVFALSTPVGIWAALVLLSNNIRDIDHDLKSGIKTLPIIAGRSNALKIFTSLILLTYFSIVLFVALKILPIQSLLVLLSLPFSFKLCLDFSKYLPDNADSKTAKQAFIFQFLLIASLL
ncbi:MAG TPA: prenyltransferase, partial [Candidatus Omnitrophota bacterium]|nr:prenyltransferase [Candidatus Omnitrophota bacterium]